jgi:hypothetical protein
VTCECGAEGCPGPESGVHDVTGHGSIALPPLTITWKDASGE